MANPTESALGSTAADALSGTADSNTGRIYNTIGDSTYYTEHYEHEVIANRILALANELRVVKDAALTYGVFAGKYMDGTTEVNYAGSTGNALTDDDTNYIYLTAAGTLTKNTTGFPDEGTTPHIPLATILTASGAYAHTDITDMRGRAIFSVLYGVNAATIQDRMPYLAFTGVDDADGTGSMAIQVKDAVGNNLSDRFLLNVWIADADFSEPDAQTGFTVDGANGELKEAVEANADLMVITTAAGYAKLDIDAGGAKTVYVMATTNGQRIMSEELEITNP